MILKKISIKDYGPLRDVTVAPGLFECIYGLNESGKTAFVEALSHVLFKRNVQALRYGKPEHIEITIDDDGSIHSLPARDVRAILPQGDIANLMYVQASESTLYTYKGEESFWDSIIAMLSEISEGLSIGKIDSKIFDAVGLTAKKGEWKDEKRQFINSLQDRKMSLETYLGKLDTIEKKDAELSLYTERIQQLQKMLREINQYKKYQVYRELLSLHTQYRDRKTQLQDYERYKHDYLERWQELEAQRKSRRENEKELAEIEKGIAILEKDLADINERQRIFEKEGFNSCVLKGEPRSKPLPFLLPIVIMISASFIVALSFFTTIPVWPALAVWVVSCIICAIISVRSRAIYSNQKERKTWLKKSRHFFPDINNLNELAELIKCTQEEKIAKETAFHEKHKIKLHLSRIATDEMIDKSLAELRSKTGLAELADLKEKLQMRHQLEQELHQTAGKIIGMLSQKDDRQWKRLIDDQKTTRPDPVPDPSQEKDIVKELEQIQKKATALTSEITVFRETMKEKFNITDDRSAFLEYNSLRSQLQNYALEKKAAHAVRQILNEMTNELDATIDQILRGNESLSEYFQHVTERYIDVVVRNKDFIVKDHSGRTYRVEQLSSGAQDQLRLCFRMAALKRLFPKGSFLLLDDAFIFADWQRRARLTQLLEKFVEDGNQAIYLTSDDHTRDLLAGHNAHITLL